MRFQVLGNFEVLADARDITPSAPKLRQAFALLILRHNEIVPVETLIDELWGIRPPSQAVRTVQTYIYELRRNLAVLNGEDGKQLLLTRPSGYMATVHPNALDVHSFSNLVKDGREALVVGNPAGAKELLTRALSLWHGRALANVDRGDLLEVHATELEESRLRAMEMRVDADFQLNQHFELIGELKSLAAANPLHEGFHAKLMLALYRSGRRSEGLAVYQQLRRRLIDELGLEPVPEAQRLQQALLAADPTLDPDPGAESTHPGRTIVVRPAQLPPDIVDFTGRRAVLRQLRGLLEAGHGGTAVPMVSIVGMAGVGKTTTAVHFAHMIRSGYPDGQLYVPLGGCQAEPRNAGEVLARILRVSGAPISYLPDTLEERMGVYRTWILDRRVLLLLDDADSATQVQPLLPGGTGCAVIITSRAPLYGLRGLKTIELDVFSPDEGVELLAQVIGRERVDAERPVAAAIVRMVSGLPLAVNFVGERLTVFRTMRLSAFATKLRQAIRQRRLSDLSEIGLDLFDRLEASFRRLTEHDQRAFLRLARLGRVFTTEQVAKTLSVDNMAADILLMRLVDARLVRILAEIAEERRYGLYRFVYAYASERAATAEMCVDGDPCRRSNRCLGSADPAN
jgi:DNA-binding SARP family transcriptional activator